MRGVILALVLLLAAPVRAAEPVDVRAGTPAPFDCACVDAQWAESIRVKRATCELARADLEQRLLERPTPGLGVGTVLAVGGIALVVGTVLGVLAGARASR